MQYNDYYLYNLAVNNNCIDKVDDIVFNLKKFDDYNTVLNYLSGIFGDIESKKLVEYPELQKQVEIVLKKDAIEFFAAKNWKQFFGKGWKKFEGSDR